MVIKYNVFCK